MTKVVIELDDAVGKRLATHAAAAGYADAAAFVASLVSRELHEPSDPTRGNVAVDRCEADLEALLVSRLDGGPSIAATPAFWAGLRLRTGLLPSPHDLPPLVRA